MLPLLAISALVALLVFVAWDRMRLKRGAAKPLAVIPSAAESSSRAVKLVLGLALVMASIGLAEYFSPSQPPFTGRYSFLKQALFEYFGAVGLAGFWFAVSAALLVIARSIWRHTPKIPPQA